MTDRRIIPLAISTLGITALALGTAYLAGRSTCDGIAAAGRRTEFRIESGCHVEVDGEWVARNEWRARP